MAIELAAALAPTVVRIVLPYVKKGATALADELGDRVGEGAAAAGTNIAGRIWNRVKDALSASGEEAVVEQFERRPEASEKLLEDVLRERLEQDPELAQELKTLVDQEITAGRDVVQLFGDGGIVSMPGGVVTGGIVAGNIGSVVPPPPAPPGPTSTERQP